MKKKYTFILLLKVSLHHLILPISENEGTIEAVFFTSEDGKVSISNLALGRYTIKAFDFEEVINIPFTVLNEKELNFEIPVTDKIIKPDEDEE